MDFPNTCFAFCLACAMFLLSCGDRSKSGVHPDYDRLPSGDEVSHSVDLYSQNTSFPISVSSGSASDRLTIGDDSLYTNEYHGMLPRRIDMDNNGRIYISQWTENTINVYSPDGEYLYSIGQEGFGPGEFEDLQYFIFDSTYTTLYALDRFEVEVFELEGDSTYQYRTSFNHNIYLGGPVVATMCMLDSNLYISGFTNSYDDDAKEMMRGINIIDMNTFEQVTSFGYVYETYQRALVNIRTLSHMFITCNEQTETVVAQHHDFPFVFGYSKEGKQKWISRIDNFISAEFPETKEGAMGLRTNENPYHRIIPFRAVALNEFELLQVRYAYPRYEDDIEINDPNEYTILIHSETGELYIDDQYPIFGAIKDSVFITIDRGNDIPKTYFNTFYVEQN